MQVPASHTVPFGHKDSYALSILSQVLSTRTGRLYKGLVLGSKVASIRTSVAHGKIKRQGRFAGQRPDWKKAYVKLREGQKMPEFLDGA